jgi:trigger factor
MRPTKAAIKSIEETPENKVVLEIEVPVDVVEKEVDKIFREVARHVTIPGFRKGKAPRRLVENRVGSEYFYEEAQKELINDAFMEAILTTDIKPLSSEIIESSVSKGEPLKFKVSIEKEPVIDVENYRGIEVEVPKMEVTEENVEAALKDLQNRYSKMILVKDRPAQKDDLAMVEFYATDENGNRVSKIGEDKNFRVKLGSGNTIPGFEDGIVGMNLGEERDVECTFPEDYNEEELRGKTVTFHIKLKELKENVLPELNDDFAKELGEHETLEDLKNHIREDLERANRESQDNIIVGEIIEKLVEANKDMEVPEEMVESSLKKIKRNLDYELRMYHYNLDMLLAQQGKSMSDFDEESKPRAIKMAQSDIILSSIAQKENIVATEEEVDEKVKEWAENLGKEPEEFAAEAEREGVIRTIKEDIVMEKVKTLLKDSAKITYVEKSEEEENE